MKIRILSDLHIEFGSFAYNEHPDDKESVLFLAGDIHTGIKALPFVKKMCNSFKYVIMIAGNHEFYQNEITDVISKWKNISTTIDNLYFLNNETVIIDGIRIIGGTMWTNLNNKNPLVGGIIYRAMNDFRIIKYKTSTLKIEDWLFLNNEFEIFIDQELSKEFNGKTIVMTHHSPCELSVSEKYKGQILNYGFFSDMTKHMFSDNSPSLWIHGHMHNNSDYTVGNTRVICNPKGYEKYELNPAFNSDLTIKVN